MESTSILLPISIACIISKKLSFVTYLKNIIKLLAEYFSKIIFQVKHWYITQKT